ncbi:MAG: sigma factor-like helix-turn-helix DNA-binding protein, partial [Anaerolineae bacterium]|nr:sigma factor-like helix-turn-helix DNA-binding protein [Anaerolineae bacterium]
LEEGLGRRPTIKELASELKVDNPREVEWIMQLGQQTLSLNAPVKGREGESELLQFIEDENTPSPFQQVQQHLMQQEIKDLMQKVLEPRELEVLRRHFGLWDAEVETLQSLADDFELSRERIRQIERRALRKLRRPRSSYRLREYMP